MSKSNANMTKKNRPHWIQRANFARLVLALGLVITMFLGVISPARADGPLIPGYTIVDGRRVAAPTGYVLEKAIIGDDQASGPLSDPADLFRDPNTGNLLVADKGNNRVVVLDPDGKYISEIGGDAAKLKGPEGVFVDDVGQIWIADTGNKRLAVFSMDGTFVKEQFKPESSFLEEMDYSPSKIVVDKRGFVYVVTGSENSLGVVVVDNTQRFRGFFGRTKVPFNLNRVIARFVSTEQQRQRMLRVQPAPLGNIHLDSLGFIYAVSPVLRKDQIQRLNSVGTNVFGEVGTRTGAGKLWDKIKGNEGIVFGETETQWGWNNAMRMSVPTTLLAQFIDIAVDDLGIVSVIDSRNSRIYQYDQAGNLLTIFGGKGASEGFFRQPISIVAGTEGLLYVLDQGRGNIQVFRPTELTRMVHQASYEYFNGDYDRAAQLWGEIAQRNTSFSLAHSGLGKALMGQKRYVEAMQEYYYAENASGYSSAFSEFRYLWMRDRFTWIGAGAIGLILGGVFVGGRTLSGLRRLIEWLRELQENAGLKAVPVLLGLAILSWMVSQSSLSFHFRTRRPEEIRLLFETGKILIPWVTWCISAYAVGEIFFGEGTFRKIVMGSAWALWPLIVFAIPVNLLTNVISLSEAAVYNTLWWAIWITMGLEFFLVIKETHNFEFGQAILVSLLTLVGIVAIWILLGLVYALTAEIFRFIGQVILEIYVRLY